MIGVAAVVAVTVSTATTNQACQDMYVAVAGRAALEVAAEADGFFDEALADQLEQIPGVKAAVPTAQKYASLSHAGNKLGLLVRRHRSRAR